MLSPYGGDCTMARKSKGALFERTVLKDCLPASLNTIYAQAKAAGFEIDGFYGAVGHLAWAFSRGYITIDGQLADLRV